MDKYEHKVKLAQIEKLAGDKEYEAAAQIADGIDWRKEKSIITLNMIADIYEELRRFEDCYEILNMIYDRSAIGRNVVYRMTEVSTKMHNYEEALEHYMEYTRIAPHAYNRYVLKYHIYRERGSSITDQIAILEEYKSHEYEEQWVYELACLYEEAGLINQCVEECDELILWFSEGEYVVKAMELKMKYRELTASQKEKYEHRFDVVFQEEEQTGENPDKNNPDPKESDQQGLAQEDLNQKALNQEDSAQKDLDQKALDQQGFHKEGLDQQSLEEQVLVQEGFTEKKALQTQAEEKTSKASETTENTDAEETEADTPKISEINTNKFNTQNLQEELAKGLQLIWAQISKEQKEEFEKEQKVTAAAENAPQEEQEPEVQGFISEQIEYPKEELEQELRKYAVFPKECRLEDLIRVEEDGQLTLAMDEEKALEKQITGQMTIEEILAALEKTSSQLPDQEEEEPEEKHTAVLFETGDITDLLKDFMPRVTKELEKLEAAGVLEGNTAKSSEDEAAEIAESDKSEEDVTEEAAELPESGMTEEETVGEEAAEEVRTPESDATEEAAEENDHTEEEAEEEILSEDFEDDLPMDIDLADVLEAALNLPKTPTASGAESQEASPLQESAAEESLEEKEFTEAAAYQEPAVLENTIQEKTIVEETVINGDVVVEKVIVEKVMDEAEVPEEGQVSEDATSMLETIEKALTKEVKPLEKPGQYLTNEQENIFAYFTKVGGMKKQLFALLDEDDAYADRKDSMTGNLIITGHPGNGKTTLAINIVKALQMQRNMDNGRIAKISGVKLNQKNPRDIVKKLGGTALIIERAGALEDAVIEQLSAAMEGITGGLLVILEDDAREIEQLLMKNRRFAEKFNRFVDIPIFSNKELVAFGKSYAEEQNYSFEEKAVLALYNCIGVKQTANHVVNITEVKGFVDAAIANAETKKKNIFVRISKKRTSEDGRSLLLEEDFMF